MPYASKHLSSARRFIAHEVHLALRFPLRARRCRVHRIPSRVRDDRDTPLEWGGTTDDIDLIWVKPERKYFCKWGWTGNSVICPSGALTRHCEEQSDEAIHLSLCGQWIASLRSQ